MRDSNVVNVSGIIDDQPIRRITVRVFGICFLAMLSEGYDLGVTGYAAPGILKGFGIVRDQMAPIFSAALFGMLVGALCAGIIGDKFGRKSGIIIASIVVCVGSFVSANAPSLQALFWARFIVGLGLGGILPNVTALMAEFLPKRIRGAFTTYAFMGITAGGILPSLTTGFLREEDWRSLFVIGGIIPLFCVPLLLLFLPESLKFLALHDKHIPKLRHWLHQIAPDLPLAANARFVIDERKLESSFLRTIFAQRLKIITPTLWLCFIAIMMVNFFVNSWLTVLLRDIGYTHGQSALTSSLYYVGGVTGGLVIGFALDRIGSIVLALATACGAVATIMLGAFHGTHGIVDVLVFIVGFSVLGSQVGMSSLAGMLYQTAVRSKGAGLAHSIGRLGAISGPLIAGVLMADHVSLLGLFSVPAIPMTLAAVGFFLITWTWTGRAGGRGFVALHAIQTELDAAESFHRPASTVMSKPETATGIGPRSLRADH